MNIDPPEVHLDACQIRVLGNLTPTVLFRSSRIAEQRYGSLTRSFDILRPSTGACNFGQRVLKRGPLSTVGWIGANWRDLGTRISAALPLAPDSAAALGFVREWMALLAPFSAVASPAMWEGARAIYDDVDNWRGEDGVDPGFDGAVWRFIGAATSAALARGEDIGPVPAWMQANPSQETE